MKDTARYCCCSAFPGPLLAVEQVRRLTPTERCAAVVPSCCSVISTAIIVRPSACAGPRKSSGGPPSVQSPRVNDCVAMPITTCSAFAERALRIRVRHRCRGCLLPCSRVADTTFPSKRASRNTHTHPHTTLRANELSRIQAIHLAGNTSLYTAGLGNQQWVAQCRPQAQRVPPSTDRKTPAASAARVTLKTVAAPWSLPLAPPTRWWLVHGLSNTCAGKTRRKLTTRRRHPTLSKRGSTIATGRHLPSVARAGTAATLVTFPPSPAPFAKRVIHHLRETYAHV